MIICSCEDLWKLGKILSVSKMIHCSSFITFLAGKLPDFGMQAQQPTETCCHRMKKKSIQAKLPTKPACQAPSENFGESKPSDLRPMFTSPRRQVAKSPSLPSGEHTKSNGKSTHFSWENHGKSTISMAVFHSFLLVHQRVSGSRSPLEAAQSTEIALWLDSGAWRSREASQRHRAVVG